MKVESSGDDIIADILATTRTIAIVGASANPARPSHEVMGFLIDKGFEVFPVNPSAAGQVIHGRPVHADLADLPRTVDMVDIFRRSEFVAPVVDQAIDLGVKTVWMQLGVEDEKAADKARSHGLTVVMNRCPVIEWRRLGLS